MYTYTHTYFFLHCAVLSTISFPKACTLHLLFLGSEEKIKEEGTSTSNSSLGSLSVFASEHGSSKEI